MAFKTPVKEDITRTAAGYFATAGGFFGAHAINALIKKQYGKELPWWGSSVLGLAIGMAPVLFGGKNSTGAEALKGLCYGVGTYEMAKGISQLSEARKDSADPVSDYILPESFRQALKSYFPSLGGTDDFPAFSYYNRGTLNLPALNNPMEQVAPMGNLNYSIPGQNSLLGMGEVSMTPLQKSML